MSTAPLHVPAIVAAIALACFACSAPASEGSRAVDARGSLAAPPSTAGAGSGGASGRCPPAMAEIEAAPGVGQGFCIDRYEASLVEILPNGVERSHSPYDAVGDAKVRAVSAPNVFPQGYISAVEAQRACSASGKRLCRVAEWQKACRGPAAKPFGYGASREPGRCNDNGRNPVLSIYGRGHWTWGTMNQPELNRLDRTLARTGEHAGCTNEYGVFDMVGNLHEWVADPKGAFYGGYYQDVASRGHGEGCGYQTTAHEARYHDYSTGFRCCADLPGAPTTNPMPAPPPPSKVTKRSRPRRR